MDQISSSDRFTTEVLSETSGIGVFANSRNKGKPQHLFSDVGRQEGQDMPGFSRKETIPKKKVEFCCFFLTSDKNANKYVNQLQLYNLNSASVKH